MQKNLVGRQKYDLILLDPPWENKHVKRTLKRRKIEERLKNDSKEKSFERTHTDSYEMLENDIISEKLNIDGMPSPGGLLVIYCTNSDKHQKAIKEWLDRWKLVNLTKWYWLKVKTPKILWLYFYSIQI